MTWIATVTFEGGRGGPVSTRQEIVENSEPDVARKAVFRALAEKGTPKHWESCVVVMERKA
jgi:hypothetical protein